MSKDKDIGDIKAAVEEATEALASDLEKDYFGTTSANDLHYSATTDSLWLDSTTIDSTTYVGNDLTFAGGTGVSSGSVLISSGGGSPDWGTIEMSSPLKMGPWSIEFSSEGSLEAVCDTSEGRKEFHISASKVLDIFKKLADIIVEGSPNGELETDADQVYSAT